MGTRHYCGIAKLFHYLKYELSRVGEVPQWLRVPAILSEDLDPRSSSLMALATMW